MLMPLERLRSILELLFREGVLVGERDGCPRRTHPQLPGVANVEVRRAMASLRSRGLVRQTAAWRHLYWYLTDAGVAHLRQYLRLPPDVVPRSLQRVPRPAAPRPRAAAGPHRARPAAGDRLYRRKDEGVGHVEPSAVSAAQGVAQPPPQPGPAAVASGPSFQPGGAEPGPCQRRESPAAGGAGPAALLSRGCGSSRAAPTSRGDRRGCPEGWPGGHISRRAPGLPWLPDPRVGRVGLDPVQCWCQPIRLQAFPPPRQPLPENPAWNPVFRGRGRAGGRGLRGPRGGGGGPVPPPRPHYPPARGAGVLRRRGRAGALSSDVTATPEMTAG
ncbi:PREDICTED: putative 40S ribosomal protein S10-like [Pseudopodoces humilis]|uniref:putative 40S ribosomal protein S10-like n=1 Tax=Pseudopodoces humilis TaxID=181119 RepID=UPI0006B77A7F|nr:PREDICTED: putative 40S ribosomal protein S10-like [Pseudopodoces humilis]